MQMSQYQEYIHMSRYSRWRDDLGRRELWPETVQRLIDFYKEKFPSLVGLLEGEIKPAILNLEVMPSMRSLMTAGPALDRENIAAYNCFYHAINHPKKFAETLYILMCGTGVGFSCEAHEVNELPVVPKVLTPTSEIIRVGDSKAGWSRAYLRLIRSLYDGEIPAVDVTAVRPAGARLRTFGGRASGPEPFMRLWDFTVNVFLRARGRKLKPIEVHDVMCMIGEVVVVGGVRRSALISLSDLGDPEMRNAKSGKWWETTPWRSLANNSAVYDSKPGVEVFLQEWLSLVQSKSGERGIFNREASAKQAALCGRDPAYSYGCNPCSEIILRDGQFCNLSEVVLRTGDSLDEIRRKVRIATILGTLQATLTRFNFVRAEVTENTEEERLLGVSLTGVYDHAFMSDIHNVALPAFLEELRKYAREVNHEYADLLGIPRSAAITCVKPSGTVSQLCDTASGLHPRHGSVYLRTTRIDKKDPLYAFLKASGMYIEDDVQRPDSTAVVYWPDMAPQGVTLRSDVDAIAHLELWLTYQRYWCEHKPSVTINVKEHEWVQVGAWVYENFDEISGISFLPYSEHTYQQAPYTEVTHAELQAWLEAHPQPDINWRDLAEFEYDDFTTGTQEYACAGGNCEIPS